MFNRSRSIEKNQTPVNPIEKTMGFFVPKSTSLSGRGLNIFIHNRKRKVILKYCLRCNKEFYARIDKNSKFCSQKCSNKNKNKGQFKKGVSKIAWNKGKKCPQFSGKNHPNWKGGKKISRDKYILIKKPYHPFCDKQKYVREHRLVMEKHLGRFLELKEVVHHINGKRYDNRLENLMLFNNFVEHLKYHKLTKAKESYFL